MVYRFVLIFLIIMSMLSKNRIFAIAASVILVISFINDIRISDFIQRYFLDFGMFLLMLWMLVPLIQGDKTIGLNIKDLLNLRGAVSFLSGALVVVLASKGVAFLNGNTDVITGVITGSVIGIAFLGGVPVGPLIASGIAYEIIKIINIMFNIN